MLNVIFPITEDTKENKKLLEVLKKKKGTRLIVGVKESLKKNFKLSESENVVYRIYADESKKEEMINSLNAFTKKGKILFIRKPITEDELDGFLSSKSDITICSEKKRNAFSNFFYKLGKLMTGFLFGFTTYGGKNNAILFGEEPSDVLRMANNISFSTRVNRWKGYSVSSVQVDGDGYKFEYNKLSIASMICLWLSLFLMSVTGTIVYFCYAQATFLSVLLFVCLNILLCIALLIAITVAIMRKDAGERYFGIAKEIKKKEKNK